VLIAIKSQKATTLML